jgi:hypothetical protein
LGAGTWGQLPTPEPEVERDEEGFENNYSKIING